MEVSQWFKMFREFCSSSRQVFKMKMFVMFAITLMSSLPLLDCLPVTTHPPPAPGVPYTGPLITARPHRYPSSSSTGSTFTETTYPSPTVPTGSRTTAHPPVIIDESVSGHNGPPGSMGLLYVFSEASKRLPIAELPMHVDYMGQSINNWAGNTVKGIGTQATSFGDTLMEYLQSAAGEALKRSGELLTTSINSLERTVKEYLSDWIGCRPPPG